MVNDSALNDDSIKAVLDFAYGAGAKIEIFNADDEAGAQLRAFGNIAGIMKAMLG